MMRWYWAVLLTMALMFIPDFVIMLAGLDVEWIGHRYVTRTVIISSAILAGLWSRSIPWLLFVGILWPVGFPAYLTLGKPRLFQKARGPDTVTGESNESSPDERSTAAPAKFRFSIATVLMAITLTAVWVGIEQFRQQLLQGYRYECILEIPRVSDMESFDIRGARLWWPGMRQREVFAKGTFFWRPPNKGASACVLVKMSCYGFNLAESRRVFEQQIESLKASHPDVEFGGHRVTLTDQYGDTREVFNSIDWDLSKPGIQAPVR